jgi:NAD(P)-dependent dehydrogenase (short-subunit alcohol dehydrogenase family)
VKTVLLTGASKGIGAATARALGEAGYSVVAQYGQDKAGVEDATAGIPDERKLLVQADFTDPGGADELWGRALAWSGRIDVLINNAAVLEEVGVGDPSDEWLRVWHNAVQVNVLAPATLTRRAVSHFAEQGGGVLITVASISAQRPPDHPRLIPYAASKAAMKTATQMVARNFAKDGVLAYIVSPGVVQTRMAEEAVLEMGGAAAITAGLPLGEWVPPGELAELITFLAAGTVRHLTGSTLDVNGAVYIRCSSASGTVFALRLRRRRGAEASPTTAITAFRRPCSHRR